MPIVMRVRIRETIPLGRDSSVGIATRYGLDGPGIESRWGQDFPAPVLTGSGAQQMGTGSFPGVKRPGRGVDHPPHLAPKLRKRRAIALRLSLCGLM